MRKKNRATYEFTVGRFERLLDLCKQYSRPKSPASFPSELSPLTAVVNQHGEALCEERVILEYRLPDRITAYGLWNDLLNMYPFAEELMDTGFSSRDGKAKAYLKELWDKAEVFAKAVEALGYHDVERPCLPSL